ncbi:hypothetical protein GCM10009634_70560 [Saccharothrix xinjiangensis]
MEQLPGIAIPYVHCGHFWRECCRSRRPGVDTGLRFSATGCCAWWRSCGRWNGGEAFRKAVSGDFAFELNAEWSFYLVGLGVSLGVDLGVDLGVARSIGCRCEFARVRETLFTGVRRCCPAGG